jgi:hypothetical protein
LCFVLARDAYPYIRKASEGSAAPSKDPHAEIVALGNKIAFNLTAPSEGGAPGECVDGVYRGLSLSQLWLIHLWPYHPMVDDPDLTALPQKVLEWFDGVFLAVAVSVHARRILETFAPHARPTLALDWLLGRTANHDWYLASEMRLRTIAGDVEMMEFLTTTLGGPANSCT